jgi:EVE domain
LGETLTVEKIETDIASLSDTRKYWIIVASKNHAQRGIDGGFVQANHGKEAPLRRMGKGDGVLIYSPKETFEGNVPCRKFTGLGEVKDDRIYQDEMTKDFHPFRRDVVFSSEAKETSIDPLIPKLSFIKNKKSWGFVFRFGLIEIPHSDFLLISSNMLPESEAADKSGEAPTASRPRVYRTVDRS